MFFSKINFGWFDGSDGDPNLVGSDREERIQKFSMSCCLEITNLIGDTQTNSGNAHVTSDTSFLRMV